MMLPLLILTLRTQWCYADWRVSQIPRAFPSRMSLKHAAKCVVNTNPDAFLWFRLFWCSRILLILVSGNIVLSGVEFWLDTTPPFRFKELWFFWNCTWTADDSSLKRGENEWRVQLVLLFKANLNTCWQHLWDSTYVFYCRWFNAQVYFHFFSFSYTCLFSHAFHMLIYFHINCFTGS